MTDARLTLSVVMPAYNAERLLPETLPPLLGAPGVKEVILVDPGSTDQTSQLAGELGATTLTLSQREGPAVARNRGVEETDSDIVLFIDADCLASEDLPSRVLKHFEDTPGLVALTGSYDDSPSARNNVSLYMNLRHHYTHQRAQQETSHFWAGMGAVHRDSFLKAGGFDGVQYPRPMIEDIELGTRMSPLGAMALDPTLQVKHLKSWSFRDMIRTDIVCRAIPWTRLIRKSGDLPNDLNLRWDARLAALLAPLALLSPIAMPLYPILGSHVFWFALPLILSIVFCGGLLQLLRRKGGTLSAIAGWFFHQLHLTYSAVSFVLGSVIRERKVNS